MKKRHIILRWFRITWDGSTPALVFIILMSFLVAVSLAAFPWLWQYLVDEIRDDADPVRLRELAAIMLAVGFTNFVLYTLLQGMRSLMNCRIEWRARRKVFEHLSQAEPEFYRRWRTGDLVTRMSDDAGEKIAWFLCSGIFRTFEATLIVLACLTGMIIIDPILTLWVVIPLPLLIVGQAVVQNALGRRYKRVQEAISGINDELSSTFAGIRIVQACGLQSAARTRFEERAGNQKSAEISTSIMQQGVFIMYGYGWQMAIVALLIAGGLHVIDGTITLGQFVTFEGFVMTLIWPMFDVGTFVSKYKQTFVALGRLQELLDEPTIPEPLGADIPSHASLTVENATINGRGDAPLVRDLDFDLRPGELLAVVGGVGSGKSTLVQLLAGERRPSTGKLRVGGKAVEELDRDELRRFIGYVPQDPVLLSAPIGENILLGREVSEQDLDRALQVSRLAQDLPAFPDGLDTMVGERGVTLSGGQQQRVALARALVGCPSILLLDDATAALDADTEAAFWEQLETVLPEIGAVVVTHRVATIQRADRVLVLEGGRIVQEGTHDDLIGADGAYRRVYGRYEAREKLRKL